MTPREPHRRGANVRVEDLTEHERMLLPAVYFCIARTGGDPQPELAREAAGLSVEEYWIASMRLRERYLMGWGHHAGEPMPAPKGLTIHGARLAARMPF